MKKILLSWKSVTSSSGKKIWKVADLKSFFNIEHHQNHWNDTLISYYFCIYLTHFVWDKVNRKATIFLKALEGSPGPQTLKSLGWHSNQLLFLHLSYTFCQQDKFSRKATNFLKVLEGRPGPPLCVGVLSFALRDCRKNYKFWGPAYLLQPTTN